MACTAPIPARRFLLCLSLAACSGPAAKDSPGADSGPADSRDTGAGDTGDTGDTGAPLPPDPVINEFMPDNERAWAGPSGEYPDWVELYNPGAEALDLAGWTMADALEPDAPHALSGVIPAGGLLLLIADGAPEAGADHLGFTLDADGEELLLWASDGRRAGWVSWPGLPPDVAAARTAGGWIYVPDGTPGAANP